MTTDRLVALSTSGTTGSVALLEKGGVRAERTFAAGLLHGRALLPALEEAFREAQWPRLGFSAVAVDVGPGSYTGCRVGLMAAKLLAREAGAPLTGVPSLDAIAFQIQQTRERGPFETIIPDGTRTMSVMLPARRGNVYAALYKTQSGGIHLPHRLRGPELVPLDAWTHEVEADIRIGPAPSRFNLQPSAAAIGILGATRLSGGGTSSVDPYLLLPLYLARSEAEEIAARQAE